MPERSHVEPVKEADRRRKPIIRVGVHARWKAPRFTGSCPTPGMQAGWQDARELSCFFDAMKPDTHVACMQLQSSEMQAGSASFERRFERGCTGRLALPNMQRDA